jgi:RNA polymerase sigma-70 factor (ECF subfamily)
MLAGDFRQPAETVLPTDEELARGVQRGSRRDLASLVERHHGPLLGFLYRMCGGDRALAEDLTQETFLRVLRAIRQYHYPRPFKPWLYAIATNAARDHFKLAEIRHADSEADNSSVWDAAADPSTGPEASALIGDEAQQVVVAVSALPMHQREAVILRYYQDLSLAEIADTLGVPVGTVKSRISLGLKRLRSLLKDEG